MQKVKNKYTILNHTADLGIRVHGSDLKELYKNAGLALMDLMIKGESKHSGSSKEISVQGQDLPDLMVRWLGEILYLFDGEGLVVTDTNIKDVSPSSLDARVDVSPFEPGSHEILSEIKAVTYHQISVKDLGDRWEAKIIFDL